MNEKKNIDKYYKKIYDNLYIKNYIGFESVEQMDIFMNTDFRKLFFKNYPNFVGFIFAVISFIIFFFLSVFSFCRFMYKDRNINQPDPSNPVDVACSKIVVAFCYLSVFMGFFIYSLYAFVIIYKNKQFEIIKNINSDDFIKDFIDEICSRVKNKLLLSSIILFSISFIFFILSWLVRLIHLAYFQNTQKEEKKENPAQMIKRDIIKDFESNEVKINNVTNNNKNIDNTGNNTDTGEQRKNNV